MGQGEKKTKGAGQGKMMKHMMQDKLHKIVCYNSNENKDKGRLVKIDYNDVTIRRISKAFKIYLVQWILAHANIDIRGVKFKGLTVDINRKSDGSKG